MYDYRNDIANIIKAIGSTNTELVNGVNAISSVMHLVEHISNSNNTTDHNNLQDDVDILLACLQNAQQTYKLSQNHRQALAELRLKLSSINFCDNNIQQIATLLLTFVEDAQSNQQETVSDDSVQLSENGAETALQFQRLSSALLNNVTGAVRKYDVDLIGETNNLTNKVNALWQGLDEHDQSILEPAYNQIVDIINWIGNLYKSLNETSATTIDIYKRINDALLKFGLERDPKKKLILANLVNSYAKEFKSVGNTNLIPQDLDALINLPTSFATMRQEQLSKDDAAKLPANCYWVQRHLTGLTLVGQSGNQRKFYPESVIHSFDYYTGDMLETVDKNNRLIIRQVRTHSDNVPCLDYSAINEFKFAVVENHNGRFLVSHDIHNNELVIDGNPIAIEIDRNHYRNAGIKVEDGTLCDLAWYDNDSRIETDPNEAVAIRWIHRDDLRTPSHTEMTANSKSELSEKHRQDIKQNTTTKLDLDLKGQTVCVAVGHGLNKLMAKRVVEEYNGVPKIIDAFNIRKHKFAKTLVGVDIVILIQSMANHSSSWNLLSALQNSDIKFAISANLSANSIGRALYRADNGLKAFEPANSTVDYPIISTKEGN